jgi:hypothetical protein
VSPGLFPWHLTVPCVDSASKNEYQVNPGGKGGRCVRLTNYHLHVPMSRNLGVLTSWNPVGLFRPVMGQLYLYLYFSTDDVHTFTGAPAVWQVKADSHIACRAHAVPLPCLEAKGLECVFPI